MRIIVTGGAGFVGTNLVKRLIVEGHDVVSLDNYSTGKRENEQDGCEYITGDINDRSLSLEGYDVIFHIAALARIQPSLKDPSTCIEANVNGTLNILNLAREHNIPVIYAGSSSVHHGLYGSPYAWSKHAGEQLCELYNCADFFIHQLLELPFDKLQKHNSTHILETKSMKFNKKLSKWLVFNRLSLNIFFI